MNMKFDIRQMFQLGNRQLEGYKKNDKLINTTVLFLSGYLSNKEPVSQKASEQESELSVSAHYEKRTSKHVQQHER